MEAVSIGSGSSPFRDFVRARVERVLASWEAAGAQAGGPPGKAALRRFLKALDELAEATDALLPEQRSVEQPSAEPAARPYVLLVIEEPGLAQDLQAGLEPEHEVERISTPERAAQSVAARTPDVVVASGSGAPETARRIRELLHGLPAVVAAPDPELAPLAVEFAGEPVVLLRGAADAKELGLAIRTMLALSRQTGASGTANVPVPSELIGEPRSYAHLAGLLPRSLEHTIEFDVGAAVVARPGSEPLVDVHATSDGGFTSVEPFAEALAKADAVLEPGAPFHIHFSDIQFANRNETKHLPYGEGTLRAEPLRDALARFERPATVISEAPDAASTRAIGDVLLGAR